MGRIATTAEQHNPQLQQMRTSPNTATINRENKGRKTAYLQMASRRQGSPERHPHLHSQPLNEVREEVCPGAIPSKSLNCTACTWAPLSPPSHQVLNHCFRL